MSGDSDVRLRADRVLRMFGRDLGNGRPVAIAAPNVGKGGYAASNPAGDALIEIDDTGPNPSVAVAGLVWAPSAFLDIDDAVNVGGQSMFTGGVVAGHIDVQRTTGGPIAPVTFSGGGSTVVPT